MKLPFSETTGTANTQIHHAYLIIYAKKVNAILILTFLLSTRQVILFLRGFDTIKE